METWLVVLLALVQALTEFLPVSSSGHLGLAGFFLGLPYQGLTFDLALHLGTLLALIAYFWKDLWRLARAVLAIRSLRELDSVQRLGLGIALSTIPAAIVGASMPDAFTESLRTPVLIAVNLIVFGVLLGLADRHGGGHRGEGSISWRDALLIGAAQALALVPGTSRSGITMTAGLALGLDRGTAARYSFLMAVPITVLAVGHGGLQLAQSSEALDLGVLGLGVAVSALAGIVVIHVFLRILRQVGTLPFVVYRIGLGLLVLGLVAFRS